MVALRGVRSEVSATLKMCNMQKTYAFSICMWLCSPATGRWWPIRASEGPIVSLRGARSQVAFSLTKYNGLPER